MLSASTRKSNIFKHLLRRSQGDLVPGKSVPTMYPPAALFAVGWLQPRPPATRVVSSAVRSGRTSRVNGTARTHQTDTRPQRPAAEPTGSCFLERREIGFVGLKPLDVESECLRLFRFAIAFWGTVGLWSATVWRIAGWC